MPALLSFSVDTSIRNMLQALVSATTTTTTTNSDTIPSTTTTTNHNDNISNTNTNTNTNTKHNIHSSNTTKNVCRARRTTATCLKQTVSTSFLV